MLKIVLTGGPCAGKTTILSKLSEKLTERGYKVFFVNEAASELILNGIKPCRNISLFDFQRFAMDLQLFKEELYEKAAANYDLSKVVIFYDRGLLDQMAYVGKNDFDKLLHERNLTMADALNRYDAVFHLVTAADGAPEYYQWNDPTKKEVGNNAARSESPSEARKMDKITMSAWEGHSRLRIFDNSSSFEDKVQKVIDEVFYLLGSPEPREIERKYLIVRPSLAQLEAINCTSHYQIVQTYLNSKDGIERRVRQKGNKNEGFSFYYTEKEDVQGCERIERESRITSKEYLDYLLEADTSLHQIVKERYCFVYNKQYFELDLYPFERDYAILEVELSSVDEQVDLPDINIIKEVTDDKNFKNYNFAKTLSFEIPEEYPNWIYEAGVETVEVLGSGSSFSNVFTGKDKDKMIQEALNRGCNYLVRKGIVHGRWTTQTYDFYHKVWY